MEEMVFRRKLIEEFLVLFPEKRMQIFPENFLELGGISEGFSGWIFWTNFKMSTLGTNSKKKAFLDFFKTISEKIFEKIPKLTSEQIPRELLLKSVDKLHENFSRSSRRLFFRCI